MAMAESNSHTRERMDGIVAGRDLKPKLQAPAAAGENRFLNG
jgi:hypothetical protein